MVRALLLIATCPVALAAERESIQSSANPIRKVVTMLQNLEKKVQSEGEKEKELYDKYMCYCKTAEENLAKSIADAETKGPELASAIEEGIGKLAQLKEDLKQHQTDRAAAKTAIAEATALREKEAAAFDTVKTESETNLAALDKAITAIEKGMGGSFVQTSSASALKQMVMNKQNMFEADREDILSFLSGTTDYAPQSGQITGILKTMHDEISADLSDETNKENAAITSFEELIASKKKEIEALSKMIEEKLVRVGDLGVEIQQMKNDAGDTGEGLVEDQKFIADLEKNCAAKQKMYDENVKMRGLELEALADTIKMLNDDDALELFKKTLPGASASFIELKVSSTSLKARALEIIRDVQAKVARRPELDFISLALRGKKIGFEKVIGMIDDLVKELKQEQVDDNSKKEYCDFELDAADDRKKATEKAIADLETAITEAKENIGTTKEEIDALEDAIRALDKSVAEATEQRKDENADYKELMANNAAAKELIGFAKNRLNKFYNPKLYKPPAASMAQVRVHSQDAPPPPPESFDAYSKKSEESNGIIAMMDALARDLQKEMTEAEATEKDAQGDYEQFMADSAEKRAEDSKSLTDKEAALAQLGEMLESQTAEKASQDKNLQAVMSYIDSLHAECDWLLKYFDMRKEARDNEIDALEKAKAVLSGADFSLVQTSKSRNILRRQ